MEAPLDPDIVTHAMKVERTAAQGNEPQAYTPATELKSLKPWTMLALAALGAVIISLWTWHWQMAMTAILLVTLCVEIKILRRVRDACSTAWRCRFFTARPNQDGRVIAEKCLSEELSGAPHSLVDFHTGHPNPGPAAPLVDAPPRDVSAGPRPHVVPRRSVSPFDGRHDHGPDIRHSRRADRVADQHARGVGGLAAGRHMRRDRALERFLFCGGDVAAVRACVEIKILRRVPPRHRRAACSTAWRCRFLAARPSQDGRAIAEK
jgi:hypothetical protein